MVRKLRMQLAKLDKAAAIAAQNMNKTKTANINGGSTLNVNQHIEGLRENKSSTSNNYIIKF